MPGDPAEAKNGMEGPRGPRGFPGPVGTPGMVGVAGVPGLCEARDCSIHAPVMRKEQGLVKRPASSKIWTRTARATKTAVKLEGLRFTFKVNLINNPADMGAGFKGKSSY